MKWFFHLGLVVAIVAAASARHAHAAIIVVAPTSSTAGSIQITDDIDFSITTSGGARTFVLNDWVTSDGEQSFPAFGSIELSITINATPLFLGSTFVDNAALTANQITPGDGYFYTANEFSVTAGDIVTLKAGMYSIPATLGFNPQATQTFTGDMFITGTEAMQLSDIVSASAVPEPSVTALIVGGGALALARRRLRKA